MAAPSPPEDAPDSAHTEMSITTPQRIPRFNLATPFIAPAMAARLSSSVLAHVLFLKNQVPFPVKQLTRIPCAKTHPPTKSSRLRADLVASFDALSSHLVSTFVALGTAHARCASASSGPPGTARAYLAFFLGPTPGAPRARVMLALDGIEVKVWGVREDHENAPAPAGACVRGEWVRGPGDDESDDDEESVDSSDDNEETVESSGEEEGNRLESSDEEDRPESSGDEEEDGLESSSDEEEDSPESSGYEEEESPEAHASESNHDASGVPAPSAPAEPTPTPAPPAPAPSHAETERAMDTAERLLARTLAAASDADSDSGPGISPEELRPTQTHILLRAPRRFKHPAWTPLQRLGGALAAVLGAFCVDAGVGAPVRLPQGKGGKKVGVEGVWVACAAPPSADEAPVQGEGQQGDEGDDLIWWAWDGKIVGFADWW